MPLMANQHNESRAMNFIWEQFVKYNIFVI
jgi:hypothetical protein